MSEYKCKIGKTLALSDPAIKNFWLRDFPKNLYSFNHNISCLQVEYRVKVEDENIVFPDAESYMRFKLEWS